MFVHVLFLVTQSAVMKTLTYLDDSDDDGLLPLSCSLFSCVKLLPLSFVVAGIMKVTSIRIIIGATMVGLSVGSGGGPPPAPSPIIVVPDPDRIASEAALQIVTDALNALTSVNSGTSGGVLANSVNAIPSFVTETAGDANNAVNTVLNSAAGILPNNP
jgi:hypothetical protein